MNEINLSVAKEEDFLAIANFIAPINKLEENQCLHAGENPKQVYDEMMDNHSRQEIKFVKAIDKDELIGVLGCDCMADFSQIWLWGPYIKEGYNWENLSKRLYDFFLHDTPQAKEFWQFLNVKNERSRDFFKQKNFVEKKHQSIMYLLEKDLYAKNEEVNYEQIVDFELTFKEGLHQLHNAAFPNPYYSTAELLQMNATHKHKIYIKTNTNKDVLGYIFVSDQGSGEGYVHFVAVQKESRGQKIGVSLLQKGIEWLFDEGKSEKIFLTVSEHNNARRLYKKVRFQHVYTGIGSVLKTK